MPHSQEHIEQQLRSFKARHVKKRLLEGLIVFIVSAVIIYLSISGLEAFGRFNSWVRALLLLFFLSTTLFILFIRVGRPLLQLLNSDAAIQDEEAASRIGAFFPSLGDKLLNYIQLSSHSFSDNALAKASLNQRANELSSFNFTEAISYKKEKRGFLQWVIPLVLVTIMLLSFFPASFVGSTERIINFSKPYIPEAPFKFTIEKELIAFRNEDFLLEVMLKGDALPQEAYFISGDRRIKLITAGVGKFELLFPNIEMDKSFVIEAASFESTPYQIKVVDRPSLNNFSVGLNYPPHIKQANESFNNIGSFEIPEGTTVTWNFNSRFTENVIVSTNNEEAIIEKSAGEKFIYSKSILSNFEYGIELSNQYGTQQGTINYNIQVIKDEYPKIEVKILADTLLYKYVVFAGNISDDHGLSQLSLRYSKNASDEKRELLAIDRSSSSQSVFHQWLLDSLNIEPGDKLDFYLVLTDNDKINKYKSTRSQLFSLNIPAEEEARAKLDESKNSTKEQVSDAADDAKELKENIDNLLEQMKGKKELTWQDEQMLQNLLEEKKALEEKIEKLQKDNQQLNEQQKQLESPSEEMIQKQEQLEDLLNDLLDEETRELYEQLQEMIEKYENNEAVQEMLEKIQNKELNLEQELERALEFFKQLQAEQKLDETREELDKIIEEQKELTKKTEDKNQPKDSLASDQGKLNDKFQKFQEDLRDAKEMNQDLKSPSSMEDTSGEEESVNEEQKSSKENLENNKRNKSKESQKNATQQMEQISKKLESMKASMQMQKMQEDLGNLQAILSNLIELSFDQENLMKEFKGINQNDPRFVSLSQEQLILKDDSKIINDSLIALSSRVMVISSFVTRELNEMNQHMDASIKSIRDRKKSEASVSQQLTMTSANNLALMLDNVMQQMQENMADAMGKGEKQDGDQQMPGLSEMQEQLNKQIRELSQSEKSGRELSEELAKLAAEQERLRKALEDAEEKYGSEPGSTDNLKRQMERSELDLVNKNLNQQMQRRQQQILTRMLEAEKSLRERELDSKREAKTATQYEKLLPKAFDDYMKQREKEIELLKTVPPRLVPFFKIEVGQYFDRIKQNN